MHAGTGRDAITSYHAAPEELPVQYSATTLADRYARPSRLVGKKWVGPMHIRQNTRMCSPTVRNTMLF